MGSPGAAVAHARPLMHGLMASIYRLDVRGAGLVPRSGPVLLVANHIGLLDGPLLVAAGPRPIRTLAKSELFVPGLGQVMRWGGQIRVDYQEPDRVALEDAVAALRAGQAVGVFPEGHRGRGDVSAIRSGAAYLLARVPGVPVVPVAVLGTRHTGRPRGWVPRPGSRLTVVFGDAVQTGSADPTRVNDVRELSERVRRLLADHVRVSVRRTGVPLPEDDVAID